jgi:hypothetical protein
LLIADHAPFGNAAQNPGRRFCATIRANFRLSLSQGRQMVHNVPALGSRFAA